MTRWMENSEPRTIAGALESVLYLKILREWNKNQSRYRPSREMTVDALQNFPHMLSLPSIPSNSFTNAAFSLVFYVALPAFLFLYLIRSYPRISKLYLAVGYYICVLGRFATSKFVFWILKWVFTQIFRGCKALAWFGFYVHFFMVGMNFVTQGYNSSLDFLAGFAKAMEEAQEERKREAEARRREERARAAYLDDSAGDEQKPKDSPKKSKRKR